MSRSIAELRATSDEKLIEEHDSKAPNTVVGVDYYLQELRRRDAARQGDRMERLTIAIAAMTAVVTIATLVNVAVFIASL
jgi:hypothetical protein